ncbi:MAG: hypothetical protein J0M02_15200 [Planctomycetes bacterium]|nr:hypothetical protein [Planctomycetota bacterium]
MTRLRLLCPALAACAALGSADVLLDAGLDPQAWTFVPGAEFPGAVGALRAPAAGARGLGLSWDFAGGGNYVAAEFRGQIPPATTAFAATLRCEAACTVSFRVRDGSGRIFQTRPRSLPAGSSTAVVQLAGPWERAWDGTDGAPPGEPAAFSILAPRSDAQTAGSIAIERLDATSDATAAELTPPVRLADTTVELAGWRVSLRWVQQWRRPLLQLEAVAGPGAGAGGLELSLPRLQRDWNRRLRLDPSNRTASFAISPPIGANPHAIYQLGLAFVGGEAQASRVVELPGAACDPRLLGAPQTTAALRGNRLGTAVHFAYAPKPEGAFAGWHAYERLLDETAAAGIGWIRDGMRLELVDGNLAASGHSLAWLRAAKARGLHTIIVLAMDAKDPIEQLCAKACAIAGYTDLVDVLELGNEPNNFGGWVKTHGGKWNGMADDGGDAPWVKAHLAATNAIAEAVKAVRPGLTVIGLGAPTPANARALRLGLSPAVDGVVDHPYSMSLPPEVLPWSSGMKARDGIAVGDAQGSRAGFLRWYADELKAAGRPEHSLWITEFGVTTFSFDLKNTGGLFAGYDEPTQAAHLVRSHLLHLWHGVRASVQYDLLDDYGSTAHEAEANFGLLRGDYSRKPAWYATQRLCSLFAGEEADPATTVEAVAAPIHRAQKPGVLIADWDGVDFGSGSTVVALPFASAERPGVRTLAVWDPLPATGFNGRTVELRVRGWNGFVRPVAIGICSGRIADVPMRADGGDAILSISLHGEPLAVRAFAER